MLISALSILLIFFLIQVIDSQRNHRKLQQNECHPRDFREGTTFVNDTLLNKDLSLGFCKGQSGIDFVCDGLIKSHPSHPESLVLEMKKCNMRYPTIDDFKRCLTNKKLVCFGDSTTNFQFISLIGYIDEGFFSADDKFYKPNWANYYGELEKRLTIPGCSTFRGYNSKHNVKVELNFTLAKENSNIIIQQIISYAGPDEYVKMTVDYLLWALTDVKANVILLNFGHWWYDSHLNNAFGKTTPGEYGQAIIKGVYKLL